MIALGYVCPLKDFQFDQHFAGKVFGTKNEREVKRADAERGGD